MSVETALIIAIALIVTLVLVARELRRNQRAQQSLLGERLELRLEPPWSRPSNTGSRTVEGTWAAWYREGTLGAYLVSSARLRDPDHRRPLAISHAELTIQVGSPANPDIRARVAIPVADARMTPNGEVELSIDAHISGLAEEPGPGASLTLTITLEHPARSLVRRLCPVEHRFAATGV